MVHSHSGYSSSGSATGSSLFFRKFKPLSGVPAATELRTRGAFFSAAGLPSFFAAGVADSLKGCAADVDVAAGGACDEGVGAGAETGAALRRAGAVVKARDVDIDVEGSIRVRDAARRQVRQIIVGGMAVQWAFWIRDGCRCQKFTIDRKIVSPSIASSLLGRIG